MDALDKLRYPIGKFKKPETITDDQLEAWIKILEELPGKYSQLVAGLTEEQLETQYRPGGWTIRQVVHHVADSHHNSYTRFKWGLTEDNPVIKVYQEDKWAALFDTKSAPIQPSLDYLKVLHYKLTFLLRGLSKEQLKRTFIHPVADEATSLLENVGRYAWHGSHHYAHIENAIKNLK
ncbi:bacillithiol transferase BstA [Flavobacteriaceae bacterium R38]|nr:bacillithiol transferase BstA [Flavobacteriaceae bacterium R38]